MAYSRWGNSYWYTSYSVGDVFAVMTADGGNITAWHMTGAECVSLLSDQYDEYNEIALYLKSHTDFSLTKIAALMDELRIYVREFLDDFHHPSERSELADLEQVQKDWELNVLGLWREDDCIMERSLSLLDLQKGV